MGAGAIGTRSSLGTLGIDAMTDGGRGRTGRGTRGAAGGGGAAAGGEGVAGVGSAAVGGGVAGRDCARRTDMGTLISLSTSPGISSSGLRIANSQNATRWTSSDRTIAIQNSGIVTTSVRRGGSSNQGRYEGMGAVGRNGLDDRPTQSLRAVSGRMGRAAAMRRMLAPACCHSLFRRPSDRPSDTAPVS
jgi:hypothetical protein